MAVSIFVNRLQFLPGEDFEHYPRSFERDQRLLEAAGVDVLFAPDEGVLYPQPQGYLVRPPALANELEGRFRPGFFDGVATVVLKLFNCVQPVAAVFGKKDYQQLQVLTALEKQLNFGIAIVPAETVREADGLAMSSRNAYLDAAQRAEAVRLSRTLAGVRDALQKGTTDYAALAKTAQDDLGKAGWRVDYVAIRKRGTLETPAPGERQLVILAAAWLGRTRLIDNLEAIL